MSRATKNLDRALSGTSTPPDQEIARLITMGEKIRNAYASFTPAHSPQRAMFVRAVGDAPGYGAWTRFLAPATVTAVLLIGLLFVGRTALPGDTFYPVREVLRTVGLAPASVEEVESLVDWADRLLDRAEAVMAEDPEAAERLAFEATRVIGMAEGAMDELDANERAEVTDDLGDVLARAKALLTEGPNEDNDRDVDGKAVLRDDEDEDGKEDGGEDKDDDDDDPSSNDRSGDGTRNDRKDPNRSVNAAKPGADERGDDGGDGGANTNDGDLDNANDDPDADDGGEYGDDDRGDTNDDPEDVKDGNEGKEGEDGDDEKPDDEPDDEPTLDVEEPKKPDLDRDRPRG